MIPNPDIYIQDEAQISNDILPVKKRKPKHKAWLTGLLSSVQWDHNLIFIDYANGLVYLIPPWVSGLGGGYVYLDRVTYIDGAVYELNNVNGLASSVVPPNIDSNWIKILDSYIGVRERARYTGQKLMLEYILNRNFQVANYSTTEWEIQWVAGVPVPQLTPPYQQIYIKITNNVRTNFWLSNGGVGSLTSYLAASSTNQKYFLGNSYSGYSNIDFSIYVPSALYTAIGIYQPTGVTAEDAIRFIANKYVPAGGIYNVIQY